MNKSETFDFVNLSVCVKHLTELGWRATLLKFLCYLHTDSKVAENVQLCYYKVIKTLGVTASNKNSTHPLISKWKKKMSP